MDEVESEVEKLKKKWEEECSRALDHICSIEQYWKGGKPPDDTSSLQQLNALVQDSLSMLSSFQHKLDALAPQLSSAEKIESAKWKLESWKEECLSLRMKLRRANLQAKEDKKRATLQERKLLLGGGEESTIRRRNLQTKAGMTSAAENITESLRRTRQLMLQEVERSSSTLITSEESTGVLRKAESEYKGHRSLLVRTRNLLSTMQRQDVIDRLILIAGFAVFCCTVLYVASKRLGILMLQRKVTEAIKAGMDGGFTQDGPRDAANGLKLEPEQAMHDEL